MSIDLKRLTQEAQARWLKSVEVFLILQNYKNFEITQEPPQKPPSNCNSLAYSSIMYTMLYFTKFLRRLCLQYADLILVGGSLFLFNRRVLRNFRNDGYSWQKKKNGKTVREGHEKLKVCSAKCCYIKLYFNSKLWKCCLWQSHHPVSK